VGAWAKTADDGKSFRSAKLSSKSFDSRVGASAAPKSPWTSAPGLELAGSNGRSLAAWTDTRLGSTDTGRRTSSPPPTRFPTHLAAEHTSP